MGFRKSSLSSVISVLAIIVLMVLAVAETVILIIPAVITGLINDRWPKWMWGLTKRTYNRLPDDPTKWFD